MIWDGEPVPARVLGRPAVPPRTPGTRRGIQAGVRTETSAEPCALCGTPTPGAERAEVAWAAPTALERLARANPAWRRADGACPACVQQALLETHLAAGDPGLHEAIQREWPLDPEAAFGALPTPLRLHAHPGYTGRGVTLALVDAGFHPHPDLTEPRNRVRAWVDATREPPVVRRFEPGELPRWPGWDAGAAGQWHGLMTSAAAAGNGRLSHGLYRGLASEADLVLIEVRDGAGRITSASIARALAWLAAEGPALGVRAASLSVAGDPDTALRDNPVDAGVAALVDRGVTVVAAAGNDGVRHLIPPATAPAALTVGGIDDQNTLDHAAVTLWHSNYGEAASGAAKPELVAPSLWVVVPLLPGTDTVREAAAHFAVRARGDASSESRIRALKLVTPHYYHADGTSVAAPLVASVVACMLEANPALTPRLVRSALLAATHPVPGAPLERQGAGALDAGQAVARALREQHGRLAGHALSPEVTEHRVAFLLHDHNAREVAVLGSWDDWRPPGRRAALIEPGLWRAELPRPPAGRYTYKFLLDGLRWLDDPDNPAKAPDGYGRFNSLLAVPPKPAGPDRSSPGTLTTSE